MSSRAPADAKDGGNRRALARASGVLALLAGIVLVAID
jgi:hypothetical protein